MKVSFVCTTYRRFYCVRRIVAMYQAQSYQNKELIIFNTDTEHPIELGFEDDSIIVVNNSKYYDTNEDYKNRGEILTDAITHATGDYFMLADDDDVYLKWHIQQAVDGITENGQDSWKPQKSLFATKNKIELSQNTMEASVIVKMYRIREIGFRTDLTGYEGLSWYSKLRDEGQLNQNNENYLPSYCFNWSDDQEIAGHKQSGDIDNPNNFNNHKEASVDYAKLNLTPIGNYKLELFYTPYLVFLMENVNQLNYAYYKKYFTL
jgi:hypothetical protein